jgi:hypothetical protein
MTVRPKARNGGAARRWPQTLAFTLAQAISSGAFAQLADSETGRQIYLEGRSGSGPVLARRAGGLETQGSAAACSNCHRRSALGGAEGRTYVPPIDAKALFGPKAPGTGAAAAGLGRDAYNEASLRRALNEGIDPSGRALDYLMPRYDLDAKQISALIAHLRKVSDGPVTGIDGETIHLATVIAGGPSPQRRRVALETLRACVAEHNAGPPPEARRKRLGPQIHRATPNAWTLHVWELNGPASTWDAQLQAHARRQPVFAMLGGLQGSAGDANWAPVHAFCERTALPCLYPEVPAPPSTDDGLYSLYASGGVRLEAALIAQHLRSQTPQRVIVWLRANDSAARIGADALREALPGFDVVERRVDRDMPREEPGAQVLLLRGDDLPRFAVAGSTGPRYLSATMLEHRLDFIPAGLKAHSVVATTHELPQHLNARVKQLKTWLAKQHLPLEEEALQANMYMACNALEHGMNEIVQSAGADYLLERLEALTEWRGFAGLYPRLSLGSGQRVASKTGYLVRFAGPDGELLEALGDANAP